MTIRVADMPDLGTVTDAASVVGELSGSGRFTAAALRSYANAANAAAIATIAALRTTTTSASAVVVANYASAGDQGGGRFDYIASDTTTADNGGTIIVDATNRRWYRATGGLWLSTKWFGVKGDGVADDTAAFQKAINATVAIKGTLFDPGGKYLLSAALTIGGPMRFTGSPAIGTVATFSAAGAGTWFVLDGTHLVSVFTITSQTGIELDHFGIYHNHTAVTGGWAPRAYPFTIILTSSQDIYLHDILMLNPTGALLLQGPGACGRVTVERLTGQPLNGGIQADFVMDVCRFNDIHFWPFWTQDATVMAYVQTHAIALNLQRIDNPIFNGCFFYGYHIGVACTVSASGSVSKASFVNCGFDHGDYMLSIGDAGTIGHALNFTASYYQGYVGNNAQAIAIGGTSANNRITLTGCDLGYTDHQAIAIVSSGALNQVFVSSGSIIMWDLANDGSTAFFTPGGGNTSRIVVSPETWLYASADPPPVYTGTAINSPAFKTIGLVTIAAAGTSASAGHNLGYVPSAFSATPTGNMTPATRFWLTSDAANVTVHTDVAVTASTSFYVMVGVQY